MAINYIKTLEARRRVLGLTVDTVADRTGVSPVTVYRWIAGDRTPSAEHVCRWAAAVRLPLTKLVESEFLSSEDPELWAADQVLKNSRSLYRPVETVTDVEVRLWADKLSSSA
ncbi:helix-turn-helix domain-containing protein [Streptomyces sp. NPDC001571]|uniref:helix-turn-helix domain-containing protein n=1 Tax=Streptomyces sp. NPDC056132 TaxID=3345722 RepID=UPI0035DBE944